MKYIDISVHQGTIDFAKVKKSGIDGVMIRLSYGDYYTDNKAFEYIEECQKHEIPFGLYHYSYATDMETAKNEVVNFVRFIKGNNIKPLLPVCIDTEYDTWRVEHGDPSFELLSDMLFYQLNYLEKEGFYAMFYCSTSWYYQFKQYNNFSRFDYWEANWTGAEPLSVTGIHQYTSKGKVDGVYTNVDLNTAFKNYPDIIVKNELNGHKKINNEKENKIEEILQEIKNILIKKV